MARPPKYSEEEKARVIAALTANEGNIKRTARECDVPINTVREWKKQAERGQLPEKVQAAVPAAIEAHVTDMVRVRDKALVALETAIENGDVKGDKLATVFGILTDKIRIAMGQATSRTETVQSGPSPEEFGLRLAEYLGASFQKALDREADIVDAEVVEQAPAALPPAS